MGLLGNLIGKKEQEPATDQPNPKVQGIGKYPQTCSVCGKAGTDKKWAGQYWHKKCLRNAKKMAKGML